METIDGCKVKVSAIASEVYAYGVYHAASQWELFTANREGQNMTTRTDAIRIASAELINAIETRDSIIGPNVFLGEPTTEAHAAQRIESCAACLVALMRKTDTEYDQCSANA